METEFDRLVDALPGQVWTASRDGEAEFFNQRWSDYTGIPGRDAVGYGWLPAIHPDDQSDVLDQLDMIRASCQSGEIEARLRRHDGVYRWFRFSISPVIDASGRVDRWC